MSQEKTGPGLGNPGTGSDKRAASRPQHNPVAELGETPGVHIWVGRAEGDAIVDGLP